MVRAFTSETVSPAAVVDLLDLARRAPSAGNTQALEFVVLAGPEETSRYWDVTLPPGERRERFRWQGLLAAPVLVLPVVHPAAYPRRYGEPDKKSARSKAASTAVDMPGLDQGTEAWTVPYWWVDGGAMVQNLLLAVTEAGLGACFFGVFHHEPAVKEAFGIPVDRRLLGAVAIGHPDPANDEPGRSATRGRLPLTDVVHQGGW